MALLKETARISQVAPSGEVPSNGSDSREVHPLLSGTEIVGRGEIDHGPLVEEVVYLRGHDPRLGRHHKGFTGDETIVSLGVKIRPQRVFHVRENGHLPKDPQV